MMTDVQQRTAAAKFAEYWKDKGYEKGESQKFWLSLLRGVFGVAEPEKFISFEDQVHLDHTSFIDGHIPSTRVLIEQKGLGKDLRAPIRQSDGSLLTPFQQAKRYVTELPLSQHPRWIVTCNFSTFLVYDMEKPNGEPEEIKLADLEKEYYRLQFLVDTGDAHIQKEMEISIQAGELVGKLYDAFLKQYIDPTDEHSLKSLNMLCVRLVFCLYAEDAGIFGKHKMFHNYMVNAGARNARRALIDLFQVLDTPVEKRDRYMDKELAAFPYVNGGLFSDENIEIPNFTDEILSLLLHKASEDFDWSAISPTIFGAVFESTLNPETRRSGGMHYTSIENIHKVIDPLFLDELRRELQSIREISVDRTRTASLTTFQHKLASLTFLDPACGSGNFLTETYLSLRRLENEVIRELLDARQVRRKDELSAGQIAFGGALMGEDNPILVSIQQFYGIEINDFAATVAKTALWIAESQMMKQTENIIHTNLNFLPLQSYVNIVEGNALRLDWNDVVPKGRLNYIMGNPPFVGYTYQTDTQKEDLQSIMSGVGKNIDYVAGWHFKAAQMMVNTDIRTAFVATNSITQDEQVSAVWKPMYEQYGIHIDFAHRTFRWDSEASTKAHVHCVIVGFSIANSNMPKLLFEDGRAKIVDNINAYLLEAPTIFVEKRTKSLCAVPDMCKGSQPTDGGNFILNQEEANSLIKTYPDVRTYVREFLGAEEFINGKKRYCLWLANANPIVVRNCPPIKERVQRVREMRLASTKAATRKWADMPMLFTENRHSEHTYIIVPSVSSEQRKYVPMGFLSPEIISSNLVLMIPNADIYHFGILTSNVHMAWMRAVCGRMKSDYRYSNTIVYNNFPWPTPTDAQKATIEKTAQTILDARALYPDCSLADLYDEVAMPPELRKAHQANDKAVMDAYGFTKGTEARTSESACVAALMEKYAALVK